MSAVPVDIVLLGRNYKMGCPQHEVEALQRSAALVNAKLKSMKENSNITNMEHLAVMAAVNLAYELQLEQQRNSDYAATMDERITLLKSTVEQALREQGLRD